MDKGMFYCRNIPFFIHNGRCTGEFVFEDWTINAIKADRQAWKNFLSFPGNYRRIKLDRIRHYRNTGRPEQADTALKNFIRDCHNGKMSPNWSDFGRLENY